MSCRANTSGEISIEAYALAANYDSVVIAEAFVDGVELTAGILGGRPLPLIKLETPRELVL